MKNICYFPFRYDFILDAVGGDTTDYSFDLLKKWSNAKIVTIMTPLLRDADTLGTVPGILKSAAFLGTKVIKVNISNNLFSKI